MFRKSVTYIRPFDIIPSNVVEAAKRIFFLLRNSTRERTVPVGAGSTRGGYE